MLFSNEADVAFRNQRKEIYRKRMQKAINLTARIRQFKEEVNGNFSLSEIQKRNIINQIKI